MKVKWFIFVLIFMALAFSNSITSAETVYLIDGRVINAKIIERGSNYIVVKDGYMINKYYNGQIERIEEDDPEEKTEITEIKTDLSDVEAISPEKAELVMALIVESGVRRSMEQNIEQVLVQVPEEKKEEFEKLFNVDEIIQRLIPVYGKYYSEEELKAIVEYHKSPAGKKVLEVTPEIMKESVRVSVDYFKEKMAP